MILGVIADDFTGATDVASMLVREGMRTVQVIGVPAGPAPQADAVVVALKSRTVPAAQAVAESLAAARWLQAAGAKQLYFKYCSTFDSTPAGNIGPVAEALLDALGAAQAIACPAFPENGRTVFRGHLFVGDQLLSDSGMRDHPLTPMTDANLVRVLQAQSRTPVGLLRHDVVAQGAAACRQRLQALLAEGCRLVVADAVANDDLRVLGELVADMPLVTAGSGVALGLPSAYVRRGWLQVDAAAADLALPAGAAAVLSGSCSQATHAQVRHWLAQGRPAVRLDARQLAVDDGAVARALARAQALGEAGPVLVYATAEPAEVKAVQAELGAERAGALVEAALAAVAVGLRASGVQRLVVAGGETSGAVVQALGVRSLQIGAPIDPGVPWTQALGLDDRQPLLLALKSGNFGSVDFFSKALERRP
jgi:3-dehydrotetronate 4-kinase